MKIDARKTSPDAQETTRMRAVQAVLDGKTQIEVAKLFGVARQTVGRWMKSHRAGGFKALKAKKRGAKGSRSSLKGWQAAVICKKIRDKNPDQLKLPWALWTSDAVGRLIRKQFGVKVCSRTVRRYLKRWGFTPQKPCRVAYERDSEEVRAWLEREYPAISARAKSEGAAIFWGDEMGMRSDHQAGRSWSPKGRTPERPGTGRRFSANMISAITNRGDLSFMVFKGRFDASIFVRFLRRLARHSGRKAFLIVDRHPVHRSGVVSRWLEANADSIEMFFLPGYSPDLNPDEYLNQDVKTNAIGKRSPRTRDQMTSSARRHLESRRRNPEIVMKYFHHNKVRYAAS